MPAESKLRAYIQKTREIIASDDFTLGLTEDQKRQVIDGFKKRIAELSTAESDAFKQEAEGILIADEYEKAQQARENTRGASDGTFALNALARMPVKFNTGLISLGAQAADMVGMKSAAMTLDQLQKDIDYDTEQQFPSSPEDSGYGVKILEAAIENAPAMIATGLGTRALLSKMAGAGVTSGKALEALKVLGTAAGMSVPELRKDSVQTNQYGSVMPLENPWAVLAGAIPHALIETSIGATPLGLVGGADKAGLFKKGFSELLSRYQRRYGNRAASRLLLDRLMTETPLGEGMGETLQNPVGAFTRNLANNDLSTAIQKTGDEITKPGYLGQLGEEFIIGTGVGAVYSGAKALIDNKINDPKTPVTEKQQLAMTKERLQIANQARLQLPYTGDASAVLPDGSPITDIPGGAARDPRSRNIVSILPDGDPVYDDVDPRLTSPALVSPTALPQPATPGLLPPPPSAVELGNMFLRAHARGDQSGSLALRDYAESRSNTAPRARVEPLKGGGYDRMTVRVDGVQIPTENRTLLRGNSEAASRIEKKLPQQQPNVTLPVESNIKDVGTLDVETASRIGRESAPIRITPRLIPHLPKNRIAKIKEMGYSSVEQFVSDVLQNYRYIHHGKNESLIISKDSPERSLAFIELKKAPEDKFYEVESVVPQVRKDYLKNKKMLLDKAQTSQNLDEIPPSAVSGGSISTSNIANEPNEVKSPEDMTDDEWLAATRFYRSGKTKNAQLPNGKRVILSSETTEKTFRETSRDFLLRARQKTKPATSNDTFLKIQADQDNIKQPASDEAVTKNGYKVESYQGGFRVLDPEGKQYSWHTSKQAADSKATDLNSGKAAPVVAPKAEPKAETKPVEPQQTTRITSENAEALANAQRLRKSAASLLEQAQSDLNRDRQTNTARRARIAAGATDDAANREAFAKTMNNLADAMERGEARYLKNVKSRPDLMLFKNELTLALGRHARKNDKPYDWYKKEPVTDAAIRDGAEFNRPHPYGDWFDHAARELEAIQGMKPAAAYIEKLGRGNRSRNVSLSDDAIGKILDIKKTIAKKGIKTPYQFARILETVEDYQKLKAAGIKSDSDLADALIEYRNLEAGKKQESPLVKAERELIGKKFEGFDFFPTPPALAERMAQELDIKPGMKVLEPSAGKGDLADAVKAAQPEADVKVIEPLSDLREILTMKNHEVIDTNFENFETDQKFDRIIMNPPFSKNRDIRHVRKAYEFLAPGGKMVAIMGNHFTFANDKESAEFRAWLDTVGGTSESLGQVFAGKDAFRQTGVNSQLVTIEKPAETSFKAEPGKAEVSGQTVETPPAVSDLVKPEEKDFESATDYLKALTVWREKTGNLTAAEVKRRDRALRYADRAVKTGQKASVLFRQADKISERFYMGQPILVGHHSERGARAAQNRMHNKMDAALKEEKKAEYYSQRAESAEKNKSISSADEDAIVKLKAKLESLSKVQERMKQANKVVKASKLSDAEKITKLQEQGFSEAKAKNLLEKDFAGRVGFPAYALQNNNAEMSRLKKRIEELSVKQSQQTQKIEFDGGEIVDNVAENRLQIFFDSKPDEATREKLKSNGFRWAPSAGAWQMHRSTWANRKAESITGAKIPAAQPAQAATAEDQYYNDLAEKAEQPEVKPESVKKPLYSAEYLVAKYGKKVVQAGWDLFKQGVTKFSQWAKSMLKQFGNAIKSKLRPIHAELSRLNKQLNRTGAIGDRFKTIESTFPIDDVAPKIIDPKAKDAVQQVATEFKSWPDTVTAADGNEILLHNPESGSLGKRVFHLIRDIQTGKVKDSKIEWVKNIPDTLKNAAVRMIDEESGNKLYIRGYKGGDKHIVVVRPDGSVSGHDVFKGKLITQFKYEPESRQSYMRVEWENPDKIKAAGTAKSTTSDSARGAVASKSDNGSEFLDLKDKREPAATSNNNLSDTKVKDGKVYSVEYMVARYSKRGLDKAGQVVKRGLELIRQAGVTFAKWARQMVYEFGQAVKKHLRSLWTDLDNFNKRLGRTGAISGRPAGKTAQEILTDKWAKKGLEKAYKFGDKLYQAGKTTFAEWQKYVQQRFKEIKEPELRDLWQNVKNPEDVFQAKSIEDSNIPVSDRVFEFLGVAPGPIYANYSYLHKQHPEYFRSPEDVKSAVEFVLAAPEFPTSEQNPELIGLVRAGDKNYKAKISIEKKNKAYHVRSVHILNDEQYNRQKEERRFRNSGEPPATGSSLNDNGQGPKPKTSSTKNDTPSGQNVKSDKPRGKSLVEPKQMVTSRGLVWKRVDKDTYELELTDPNTGKTSVVETIRRPKGSDNIWNVDNWTTFDNKGTGSGSFTSLKVAKAAIKAHARDAFNQRIYRENGVVKDRQRDEALKKKRERGLEQDKERDAREAARHEKRKEKAEEFIAKGKKKKAPEPEKPKTWRDQARRFIEKAEEVLFDAWAPVRRLQETIKKAAGVSELPESLDLYQKLEVVAGKVEAGTRIFKDKYFKQIKDYLVENNINYNEANRFLAIMHAEERNDAIAERNPAFALTGAPGSGIETETARKEIAEHKKNGTYEKLLKFAEMTYRLNNALLDEQVRYGLLSQKQRDAYRRYKHYTPMKSPPDQGFVLDRTAFGRRSEATDQLAYIEKAIDVVYKRGERKQVINTALNLFSKYSNPKLYREYEPDQVQYYDKRTGKVRLRADTSKLYNNPAVIWSRDVNSGELKAFEIKDTGLQNALNRQYSDSNVEQKAFRYFARVNRWLAGVSTAYNPEFIFTNLLRDVQQGASSVGVSLPEGSVKKFVENLGRAKKAISDARAGKVTADTRLLEEFQLAGGKTGYSELSRLEDTARNLEREISEAQAGGRWYDAKQSLIKVKDWIADWNDAIETRTRFAGYLTAKEAGFSTQKSAAFAKGMTINFNKKGTWAPVFNSLYLFSSASLGGSFVTANVIGKAAKTPKGRAMIAGAIGLGFVMELLNRAVAGDDDDEGVNYYDKVPDYIKDSNYVFMLPGTKGKYFAIPMPYGLNVLPSIGRNMAASMFGVLSLKAGAANVVGAVLNSFNPIGGDNRGFGYQLVPTAARPFIDIATNSSWTGRKIRPDQPAFGAKVARSELYFDQESKVLVKATKLLNELTGGDRYTGGFVSLSPADVGHLLESFTGGVGRTLSRGADTVTRVVTGEAPELDNVPVVRRFGGEATDYNTWQTFKENSEIVEDFERARRERNIEYLRANRQLLPAVALYKNIGKRITMIRKKPSLSEPEKQKLILSMQKLFNKKFKEMNEKALSKN